MDRALPADAARPPQASPDQDETATIARARKAFNEELKRRRADPRSPIDLAQALAEIRAEAAAEEEGSQEPTP